MNYPIHNSRTINNNNTTTQSKDRSITMRKSNNTTTINRVLEAMVSIDITDKYTIPVMELSTTKAGRNAGAVVVAPRMITDISTGSKRPMVVEKKCIAAILGLPAPDYTCFYVRDEATVMGVEAYWHQQDIIPFGSGLKASKDGMCKFYSYPTDVAIKIYGDNGAEISAYGNKLFTDLKYAKDLMCKVVTMEELIDILGYDPGFDGSGYIRMSACPKGHRQVVGVPANYRYDNLPEGGLPIMKGALDPLFDDKFDKLFGEEYDAILVKKDMIKTNYDKKYCESGEWTIGFTWNKERPFELPVMWEFTQFLKPNPEVKAVFESAIGFAIEDVEEVFSSKEKILAFLDKKLIEAKETGRNGEIESKLIAALTCKGLPYKFAWIQKQIEDMLANELAKAIHSYGVKSEGLPVWTDEKKAKTNPRYQSLVTTVAMGADNDFDLFGRFVNTLTRKAVCFRYPLVGGFAIEDIPEERAAKMKDVHPEIVDVVVAHYEGLNFNRNLIKEGAGRIEEGAYYARQLGKKIMKDAGIGMSTLKLKRALVKYHNTGDKFWLEVAKDAAWLVEGSAIGLKYHVKRRRPVYLPKGVKLSKEVPMEYRNWRPRKAADFDVQFSEVDLDGQLYNYGITKAKAVIGRMAGYSMHPSDVYVPRTMAKFNKAFIDKVHTTVDYYNSAIKEVMEAELDEESRAATMSSITAALEDMGSTMTLAELQTAIALAFERAGEENSGAFAIHLAGARLHEVFGGATQENVTIKKRETASKALRVWSAKQYKASELDLTSFQVTENQIILGNAAFNLADGQTMPNVKEVRNVADFRKKDGTISGKSFWVTVGCVS